MTTSNRPDPLTDYCAVAGVGFNLGIVYPPSPLVSPERVRGAGSLLLSYRYGDQLRFFDAVNRARELLDTDLLCLATTSGSGDMTTDLDDDAIAKRRRLLNRLYCWPEQQDRVSAATRRRLVAKVFGIPHPEVPEGDRNTVIQPMLIRLLDAINAVCDPGPFPRREPVPAQLGQLKSAAFAVQDQLSASMTELVTLQVRDLQAQFDAATQILTHLAPYLQLPCRPGTGNDQDLWRSVQTLVGAQLRASGTELFEAADMADAWRAIFEFLAEFNVGFDVEARNLPCEAAALLRPPPHTVGTPATDQLP